MSRADDGLIECGTIVPDILSALCVGPAARAGNAYRHARVHAGNAYRHARVHAGNAYRHARVHAGNAYRRPPLLG